MFISFKRGEFLLVKKREKNYYRMMLLAFYKPYGVLSQFSADHPGQKTLADFNFPKGVYPLGRLDLDSEGLLLLSDKKSLNQRLLHPQYQHERTYWVQVEGIPREEDLTLLREGGIKIQDYFTQRASVQMIAPDIPPRTPPIRRRLTVPDSWLEITLCEGKNRQVRRMTAFIGYPTLRLIRVRIGKLLLKNLSLLPGEWKEIKESALF